MTLLDKARRLEAKLARTFDSATQQWTKSGPRGPLEIAQAIVEAAAERLEPAGRGTHVFPYNRIKVSILAPSRDARARFASLFDAPPTLQDRIGARLREARCDAANLHVKIAYVDRAAPGWTMPDLHVEFDRVAIPDTPVERLAFPETVRLTIVQGSAEKPSYALSLNRINLGRCGEVRNSRNQLIRTNHVVFSEDAAGPNSTVSRRHAHIEYASELRQYRLCDDGSAYGTGIVRNGRTISVPCGARGIRLQSGDEILLGEARLRVTLRSA